MIASSTANASKDALRAEAMARREALMAGVREGASVVISDTVVDLSLFLYARVIAAYMPIGSEVDPRPIIASAFEYGLAVALPAVTGDATMEFRRHTVDAPLVAGRFGTLMPGTEAPILDPDLIVVPMVAFDRRGARLGHGRGFYDRAIAQLHGRGVMPVLVGVAFSAQEVKQIPAEAHDMRMEFIVTERETLGFPRG